MRSGRVAERRGLVSVTGGHIPAAYSQTQHPRPSSPGAGLKVRQLKSDERQGNLSRPARQPLKNFLPSASASRDINTTP